MTRPNITPQLMLVIRFASHTVAGVILFLLVAGAAALLNELTLLIVALEVSGYISTAIHGLELFLFAVDFSCLVLFVGMEAWRFCRAIVRDDARFQSFETWSKHRWRMKR